MIATSSLSPRFKAFAVDRMARCFFNQVQLHGELADLTFERRNVGLVLRDDAGLCLFIIQLAAVELRQP